MRSGKSAVRDCGSGRAIGSAGLQPEPPLGAHLKCARRGYSHHGVYAGEGTVVHYAGLHRIGQRFWRLWRAGPVQEVPLDEFAIGDAVEIVEHAEARYSREEIVRRARSRLGEARYRLVSNNCEHFCNWCVSDEPRSEQVERTLRRLTQALGAPVRLMRKLSPLRAAHRIPA